MFHDLSFMVFQGTYYNNTIAWSEQGSYMKKVHGEFLTSGDLPQPINSKTDRQLAEIVSFLKSLRTQGIVNKGFKS